MAASSSAAANPNNKSFDVFINHRGVDTKKTFAKWLHRGLRSNGLNAFIDNEEMQQGYDISSQIEDAVRSAKVHVAVLSPRYAESDWCLKELVLMLESKAPVIPVFYRVKPDEVRWTKGKYAEALQFHEKKLRYDSSTFKKWKETLHKVASNSGFLLKECSGEEELELMPDLVDDVVKSVLERLKLQDATIPDLYVAEYPTGLDGMLKDFEDKVLSPNQQSGKAHILGISGFAGIGKTTLAKQFFNKKKSEYAKSCFLSEVGDNAANLESLQSQLLKSLTGLDQQVDNVHKGKGMLIGPLKSYNSLIILDDVHDRGQVKALLPVQPHELCSGSLILITSRNRDVLRSSRVDELSIYRLTELETQHSRELFCSHAFNQTYPLPGFEDLVDKFLKSCNGLPLFLTQFGSSLYKKDISVWEDELGSLPKKIKERLQFCYNTLNTEEQQIFLDISCVFIGQNTKTAISIWDKTGWKGSRGLQNLQDKSLVELDRWNRIQMKDHLRDLGRDVAASSSPRRLWHTGTKNVIDYLLQQSSEITMRAIQMVHSEYNGHHEDGVVDINDSQKVLLERILRSLQILDTKGSLLEPILKRVEISNLIWISWENCPHSSLPSWVPIKNLRVLRVSESLLKTLWQRDGKSQAPLQLPVCLEEFCADGSLQLKSIKGLEQSTNLRRLSVRGCSELDELPSMESLVSLEELWADGCVQLKSIRGLEQATKLRWLRVSGCSELEELPSMESLVSLEELWADGCVQLKSIRGLEQATKLRGLNVTGCTELEELPSMERLVSLEELWAKRCVKLKSIAGLAQCTKLRMLIVSRCSELEELPTMERLVSLEELWAVQCVKLKSIPGLAQCTKLRQLGVSGWSELEELPNMERLVSLEELWAKDCVKLKSIEGLGQCTKLRVLNVSGCSELEELPNMERLVSLKELWAKRCVKLQNIGELTQCTKLLMLNVSGCSVLEELPSMERLESLEELWADECVQLKSIPGLSHCNKLQQLRVSGCSKLEKLPSMETLASLEELWADGCVQLKRIRGLAHCTELRLLNFSGCSELEDLPSMETLVSLEGLQVDACVKIKSIRGLSQCTKLRWLTVVGCSEIEELEGVEHISNIFR